MYLYDTSEFLDPENEEHADDSDNAHRQLHDEVHQNFGLLIGGQPPRYKVFIYRARKRVQTRGHGAETWIMP